MTRMTTVRMKVARFELISATPSLPKIEVKAAKNAAPKAKTIQLDDKFMGLSPADRAWRVGHVQ